MSIHRAKDFDIVEGYPIGHHKTIFNNAIATVVKLGIMDFNQRLVYKWQIPLRISRIEGYWNYV